MESAGKAIRFEGLGRRRFRRAAPVLEALAGLLRFLPDPMREMVWRSSDVLPDAIGAGIRYAVARTRFRAIGANVYIGPGIRGRGWDHISLGDNVSIHENCWLGGRGGIEIRSNTSIAHGCSIVSTNHTWDNVELPIRENDSVTAPIVIGPDAWIGCGVRILAGVSIGERSVVAAGAVVTRPVDPGTLVGGVPAKLLQRIPTRATNASCA